MKNKWLWIALGVGAIFAFGSKKTAQGVPVPGPETTEPTGGVTYDPSMAAAMLGLSLEDYNAMMAMAASGQLNATTAAMMGLTPDVFESILAASKQQSSLSGLSNYRRVR